MLGASEEKEEEDWLSHVLSQKKSQGLAREEHTATYKGLNSSRPPSGRYELGLLCLARRIGQGLKAGLAHFTCNITLSIGDAGSMPWALMLTLSFSSFPHGHSRERELLALQDTRGLGGC
jgi:hypothetical protein